MGVRQITISITLTAEELDAVETALEAAVEFDNSEENNTALEKIRVASRKLRNINEHR